MTPDRSSRELVELLAAAEPPEHGSNRIAESMSSGPYEMWREAEDEARETYERWRQNPSVDAYVVYLAAEDRAAAAQTALANWSCVTSAWA